MSKSKFKSNPQRSRDRILFGSMQDAATRAGLASSRCKRHEIPLPCTRCDSDYGRAEIQRRIQQKAASMAAHKTYLKGNTDGSK